MLLRDIVLTLVVFGSLPVCFARPWFGILMWSWLGYMNPHLMTWGFAQAIPFALLVAIATLAGLVFAKERQPLPRERATYLLLALWAVFLVSTFFAQYPADAWPQLEKVSKILLMTVVTLLVIDRPAKLRLLLLTIALSIGFFGLKGGIWALFTGGQYQVLGPGPDTGGSFISSNTGIGVGLNMTLPLLFFLRKEERRPWLRRLLLAMFVFSIPAVLATYSRGALLGLIAVLSVLFLKGRKKLLMAGVLVAGLLALWWFLPARWFERMETITAYEEQGELSALRRLDSWYLAYRLMLDNPVIGAGFRPFSVENYHRYVPERPWPTVDHDAHSIFFQVMAEHGLLGFGLYLGLILSTLSTLRRLIRKSRHSPEISWLHNYAQMVQASLVAYLVNGAFFSVSYFDLFYHLVVITVLLKSFAERYAGEPAPAPAPAFRRGPASWNPGLSPRRGAV